MNHHPLNLRTMAEARRRALQLREEAIDHLLQRAMQTLRRWLRVRPRRTARLSVEA